MGQIWIMVLGCSAIWLSMSPIAKTARWGCICGLLSQPAWFYESYMAEQWGIFTLCFLYLLCWMRGFNTHWLSQSQSKGVINARY